MAELDSDPQSTGDISQHSVLQKEERVLDIATLFNYEPKTWDWAYSNGVPPPLDAKVDERATASSSVSTIPPLPGLPDPQTLSDWALFITAAKDGNEEKEPAMPALK